MAKDEVSIHILRKVVIDGFLLGGLTICLTAIKFLWYPFQRGFFCGDESLMFPYKEDTVTVTVMRVVGIGLPVITVLVCEWALLRNERDDEVARVFGVRVPAWLQGFYCVCISFGIGVLFSEVAAEISKVTIGRNRPHFYDLCIPSVNCTESVWQGRYVQAHEYYCTGDQIDKFSNMKKSFVSGHSSFSAYTMIYLALYLERRMVWRGSRMLRHSLQFGVLMLSWYTGLSRVSDYKHHWSDVLAGWVLGIVVAVLMFLGTDFVKTREEHANLPQCEENVQSQGLCCSRM